MENSNPNITIADIASMISVIEAASTRGAIRANELTTVGDLYNRLTRFLDHAKKQLEQSQGDENA